MPAQFRSVSPLYWCQPWVRTCIACWKLISCNFTNGRSTGGGTAAVWWKRRRLQHLERGQACPAWSSTNTAQGQPPKSPPHSATQLHPSLPAQYCIHILHRKQGGCYCLRPVGIFLPGRVSHACEGVLLMPWRLKTASRSPMQILCCLGELQSD